MIAAVAVKTSLSSILPLEPGSCKIGKNVHFPSPKPRGRQSLFKYLTRGYQPRNQPDFKLTQLHLAQWFNTPLGIQVLKAERALVDRSIARIFGYHILQLGGSGEHSLIEDSPVGHKISFTSTYCPGISRAVADDEELPLPADSIDVVLVHHALDFTADSHRLLREAMRVLRPGGKLILLGFNPISCWGLSRLFRRTSDLPWCARFINSRRVLDWLRLLGIHVNSVSFCVHFLPFKYKKFLKRAGSIESFANRIGSPFGGAYFILATKLLIPVTPIVPRWRSLRSRTSIVPATENIRARYH
jgi:SAM-dependent methyltransferase